MQEVATAACSHCEGGVCGSHDWVPRGDCGPWTPFWKALYIGANNTIQLCYYLIGALLIHAIRHEDRRVKNDLPLPAEITPEERQQTRMAYFLFIAFCGFGHNEATVAFFWPHYPTFSVVYCLIAVVSMRAVLITVRVRTRLVSGF